jgi:hypothetical protein
MEAPSPASFFVLYVLEPVPPSDSGQISRKSFLMEPERPKSKADLIDPQ